VNRNDPLTAVEQMLMAHAATFLRMPEIHSQFGIGGLAWRASVTQGILKPRWKKMLGVRRPAFSGKNVLVEVSILMEGERLCDKSDDATRVLIHPDVLQRFVRTDIAAAIPWEYERLNILDKRGSQTEAMVWRLCDESVHQVLNWNHKRENLSHAS
jgi:hypothetical protein